MLFRSHCVEQIDASRKRDDERVQRGPNQEAQLQTLARVEIDPDELARALDPAMSRRIVEAIKPLGFRWVSLDLEGYRTGSLNEVLGTARPRSGRAARRSRAKAGSREDEPKRGPSGDRAATDRKSSER